MNRVLGPRFPKLEEAFISVAEVFPNDHSPKYHQGSQIEAFAVHDSGQRLKDNHPKYGFDIVEEMGVKYASSVSSVITPQKSSTSEGGLERHP